MAGKRQTAWIAIVMAGQMVAASVAAVSCCAADSIADDDVDSGTIRRLHLAAGASTPAYLVK